MQHKVIKTITINILLFLSIFIMYGFTPTNIIEHDELIEYNGPIEHLAFNTLISFPDKALNNNNNSSVIDDEKITPSEFKKILQELYSNNYILINMKDVFFIENNIIFSRKIYLPKNKKPLILSFNNVSYKSSFQNNGEIDKIIVDNEGKFATYSTKQNIQNRIAYDNEFLPLLEEFILNNPDFSFNNAKGIIFLTVNNGILGYHIDPKNNSSRKDQKRLLELIRRLKISGWEFGSNNYEFVTDNSLTDIQFIKNISLWNKYTSPIIDNTTYYCSPYGKKIDNFNFLQILNDNDFRVFFHDSFTTNLEIKNNSLFMARKFVCGQTIRNNPEKFVDLFDCKKIYDFNHRKTPYPNN